MKLAPVRIQHLTPGAALDSLRSRHEGLSAQDAMEETRKMLSRIRSRHLRGATDARRRVVLQRC